MDIKKNYPKILLIVYLLIWIYLAISPLYRDVWIDENTFTVVFVLFLILTYKKFRLSNFSYTLIFFFMILHAIGGHYSYTEVPIGNWFRDTFDLTRNHYDRVVHFLFGLIFFFPIYEFISKKLKVSWGWASFLSFFVLAGLKGIFEIIEYFYVIIIDTSTVSSNYLGMQGDIWDAQKDMLLGISASIISLMSIVIKKFFKK